MEKPALTHRPATAGDLDEVVGFPQDRDELFYAYPKASWPLTVGQLAAALAERRESTVALLDGRIAGFANFYQWNPGESCALGNMLVAPWARGHGVAQYLVGVMEGLARERYRARAMKISCFNANAAGLLLYTRLGYRPFGIVERSDPQGHRVALVQLEKPL
ncbi:Acetyltransferase (GNAT) family protein [compost metagenome]|uniref:Ribosomal protein S18 acetylase RimI n=1 Tax=Pseudomonas jinjuensis TaxID=198616 RepID=A0A1H0GA69_9PSED|nr:GNAT family N-acetyltransferase [Pseudomonas jinjuensis]SDO03773.1 Ribosomal protein S18 acetylase RimI [Pseudomonas jinjuensis]